MFSGTTALPLAVTAWQQRGQTCRIAGMEIFYRDTGPRLPHAVVFLHGFPSSSFDWHAVLPLLDNPAQRVIVFDFPGYGLSSKPAGYSYSLMEQADVVQMLLKRLGVKQVKLIAHDMGTSVTCELLARRERGLLDFELSKLLLLNGSVHIEMAHLTPSQKVLLTPAGPLFAQVSSRTIFKLQLQKIVSKPLPEQELEAMWALMVWNDGKNRLAKIIGYVRERAKFRERWIGALNRLDIPVTLLWGREDPVAVAAIAEKLKDEIPGAELVWLEGVGHYLQLEAPAEVAAVINQFLA
jgi:pimeloyl-ACP methyl ester carboxylesterase